MAIGPNSTRIMITLPNDLLVWVNAQAKKENSIRVKKAMQFKEVREKIRRGMKKDFIKKGCIGFFKDKKRPELSKENHWNWKNGKTPLAFAIRHLLEYKQ